MSGLSNGQQALMMLTAFLVPLLASVASWAALGMPTDRSAMGLLVAAICGDISAGIIVFAKEILGGQATTTTTTTQPGTITTSVSRMTKLSGFLHQFMLDRSAMALHGRSKGKYDPDPAPPRHRRSHRGHRRGVEPAGLKRWRLSHRRKLDPGYSHSYKTGRRGGHYFSGPHKRRYDPAPPRRHFTSARRAGGKIEGALNKWGSILGAVIAGGWGVYTGYQSYKSLYGKVTDATGKVTDQTWQQYLNTIIGGKRPDGSTVPAEISHLWGTNASNAPTYWKPLTFLKYKFTGYQPDGTYSGSAWVYPFWAGFAMTIARPLVKLFTHKGDHILKPVQKIGIGMLGVSTVGALALPGCPKNGQPEFPPAPSQANTLSTSQPSPLPMVAAQIQTKEFTYKG